MAEAKMFFRLLITALVLFNAQTVPASAAEKTPQPIELMQASKHIRLSGPLVWRPRMVLSMNDQQWLAPRPDLQQSNPQPRPR
jgi:hypothetical protein